MLNSSTKNFARPEIAERKCVEDLFLEDSCRSSQSSSICLDARLTSSGAIQYRATS